MYTVSKERFKIIGMDEDGNKETLFDSSSLFRNKSRIPLRTIEQTENGTVKVHELITEAVFERHNVCKGNTTTDTKAECLLVMDFLIADRLQETSRPFLIGLIDPGEADADFFSKCIYWFNPDHKICTMSAADHEGFKEAGFDMLVLFGRDHFAEQQLRACEYLLSQDGLMLILAEETIVLNSMIDMCIDNAEEIRINDSYIVYKVLGRSFKSWFKPICLADVYDDLCREIYDKVSKYDQDKNLLSNELRESLLYINQMVNEAQKQWNLIYKQKFLDLKEAIQLYYLNLENSYSEEYKDMLLKSIAKQ